MIDYLFEAFDNFVPVVPSMIYRELPYQTALSKICVFPAASMPAYQSSGSRGRRPEMSGEKNGAFPTSALIPTTRSHEASLAGGTAVCKV